MTTIPCKRPKVILESHEKRTYSGRMALYHLATCHVPGCDWSYDAAVVTDAQEQATRHRGQHRAAAPDSAVLLRRGGGYQAECDCGWQAADGCLTRTDNQRSLDYHLSTEHGLVVCT